MPPYDFLQLVRWPLLLVTLVLHVVHVYNFATGEWSSRSLVD